VCIFNYYQTYYDRLKVLITYFVFLENNQASTFYIRDSSLVKCRQENFSRKIRQFSFPSTSEHHRLLYNDLSKLKVPFPAVVDVTSFGKRF
jgi:hypothetical protein